MGQHALRPGPARTGAGEAVDDDKGEDVKAEGSEVAQRLHVRFHHVGVRLHLRIHDTHGFMESNLHQALTCATFAETAVQNADVAVHGALFGPQTDRKFSAGQRVTLCCLT